VMLLGQRRNSGPVHGWTWARSRTLLKAVLEMVDIKPGPLDKACSTVKRMRARQSNLTPPAPE